MEANNMAELREALVGALVILEEDQKVALCRKGFVQIKTKYCDLKDAIEKCRAALAAPPRNCEVGTSDEQAERFENFCLKHIGCAEETGGRHCVGCPLEKASRHITQKCELYWAQMPYVEKEGGNDGNE